MFLDPTVVVVGAGASAEFGLPTGIGLYEDASLDLDDPRIDTADFDDQFLSTFWAFLKFANMGQEQTQFRRLQKKLRQSHARSIDLYAYYNPSEASICKLFTAWRLQKEFVDREEFRNRFSEPEVRYVRSFQSRAPTVALRGPSRNNWIGELANSFLSGAKDSSDLAKNQLQIVTFNYDTFIEESFSWIIRQNERFADAPDEVIPPVLHVHGALEPLAPAQFDGQAYRRQAERIKFISDTIDSPSSEVELAKVSLGDALRVYCIGFAFEQLNCDLLQAGLWGKRSFGLNFDGNVKVFNSMKRVGLASENIWSGTEDRPFYLGDAASRGFFEGRSK